MMKGRKKILIYNYRSLFPVRMMTQVRIINLIKGLSQDHDVDVVTFCWEPEEIESSKEGLKNLCNNFYPLKPINPKHSKISRKFYGLKHLFLYNFMGISKPFAIQNSKKIHRILLELIEQNKYNILHAEYWYIGSIFHKIKSGVYKVIDSIAMVEENQDVYKNKRNNFFKTIIAQRMYKKNIQLQKQNFKDSDLVLAISKQGMKIMEDKYSSINSILIPIGQDIDHFSGFKVEPEPKTIVFYGTMGSQQNLRAFSRLRNNIIPLINKKITDIKLIVVGSNPPEHIKKLHNGKSVIVTGFVDDPRIYLAKASIVILPLETGAGFRGRVVELMAMGIPVLGTHNALDSIDMENGVHGIISDKDEILAEEAVKIMTNPNLKEKMSAASRKFSAEKYSIESTAGKLSKYYYELGN